MNFGSMDNVKKGSRPNEFLANCPFCLERTGRPDTKNHLGFNTKSGKWNCFRCGARTSTHGNLKKLENIADFYGDQTASNSIEKLRKKLKSCSTKPEPTNYDLELISWKLSEKETPFAYNYIVERGFSQAEIDKHGLRVGKEYIDPETKRLEKRWKGRILFPFIENGRCTYIVGRSYLGHPTKYRNSKGSKKSVVYGLDKVNGEKECIITEGLISAIAAERATGIPAVCLLGKSNCNWALSKIRSKTNRVFLSLDGGITEGTANLKHRLIGMGFEVFEVTLPDDTDPDDLKDQYIEYFNQKKKISIL